MQEKLLVLLLKIGACFLERLTGKEVALRWEDANGGLGDGYLRWLLFRGFWREDQVLEKDFGSVFCVLVRAFDVPVFRVLPETGEYAPLTEWAI